MRNRLMPNTRWKALCFAATLVFANPLLAADMATLVKREQLRDGAYIDTKAIATVAAQSRAEIIEARGAWVKIKTNAGEGWVRAASIKRDGVTAPGISPLAAASGRLAVTDPTASLGIRGVMPLTETIPASSPTDPAATLDNLFNNRDEHRQVKVVLEKPALKIGADKLSMRVTSSHPGFVYVLMTSSYSKEFNLLFPNQLDQQNQITANQPITLPRSNWELLVQGPAGTDRLLVLISDTPRDYRSLPLKPSGPFAVIETSPANAQNIQLFFGGERPTAPECKENSGKQSLPAAQLCAMTYGAALVNIEEVQ